MRPISRMPGARSCPCVAVGGDACPPGTVPLTKGTFMPETKQHGVPGPVAHARARLAALTGARADAAALDSAREQLAVANARAALSRLAWPLLSDRARLELASLILSGGGGDDG